MWLNKRYYKVGEGTVIREAEKKGCWIPRLCYSRRLIIGGNCRVCVVELKGRKKLQIACGTKGKDLKVWTKTKRVWEARRRVMELILRNHPLDCPICDKGGECDLQDETIRYGNKESRYKGKKRGKRTRNWEESSMVIRTTMTRCIHCTRCIRYINETSQSLILTSTSVYTSRPYGLREWGRIGCTGRGTEMTVGSYIKKRGIGILDEGTLIDICPVGAITEKRIRYKYRPWEIKSYKTVDIMSRSFKTIRLDFRGQTCIRIGPSTNRIKIKDKTRLLYDGWRRQRIKGCYRKLRPHPRLSSLNPTTLLKDTVFKDKKRLRTTGCIDYKTLWELQLLTQLKRLGRRDLKIWKIGL